MADGKIFSDSPAVKPSANAPIKGRYITLERLSEEHISDLWHHYDDSTWKMLPGDPPKSEEELGIGFNEITHEDKNIVYAVMGDPSHLGPSQRKHDTASRQKREALGVIVYGDFNTQHRTLEAGAIFGLALRRTVASTEAHYLLLRDVFDPKNGPSYRRVSWKTNSANLASQSAAKRLGYVYEGTWRNHMIDKGKSRDSVWLSMIDDDWPLAKAALEAWLDPKNFNEDGSQIERLEDIRKSLK